MPTPPCAAQGEGRTLVPILPVHGRDGGARCARGALIPPGPPSPDSRRRGEHSARGEAAAHGERRFARPAGPLPRPLRPLRGGGENSARGETSRGVAVSVAVHLSCCRER